MKMRDRAFLIMTFCLGFLGGCIVAEKMPWFKFWWLIIFGLFSCLILVWPKPLLRLSLIGVLGLIVGVVGWQHAYRTWNKTVPTGDVITVTGTVITDVETRQNNDRVVFLVDASEKDGTKLSLPKWKMALYLPSGSGLKYGDLISFKTKIEDLPNFGDFNGQAYWRVRGVQAQSHPKSWEIIQRGSGNQLVRIIYLVKDHIATTASQHLSGQEGALLLGLLFGNQGQLGSEVTDAFKRLGISHLTAVSGYNLTIIALWPLLLAGLLPRRGVFLFSIFLIFSFVIFTGAPSSIVRAAIMAVMVLWGKWIGRPSHGLLLILVTATLMAAANPFVVKDDAGFILSFLAFFGLIEIGPLLYPLTKFLRFEGLRRISSETFGAQLMALPYLIGAFGQLTLVGPIANLMVLPLVPFIMMVGLSAVALSLIPLKITGVWLELLYFPLHGFLVATNYFANLSWVAIPWPKGGLFPWFLTAVIIGGWIWNKAKRLAASN